MPFIPGSWKGPASGMRLIHITDTCADTLLQIHSSVLCLLIKEVIVSVHTTPGVTALSYT